MSRTVTEIQLEIDNYLLENIPTLTNSAVSQWRLITFAVALAIHYVELMYESLRNEIDDVSKTIAPGTERWYVARALEFQNGHELLYNAETAEMYYQVDDPSSRIITNVAIVEGDGYVALKVAKEGEGGVLAPLSAEEALSFSNYMAAIKFVGIRHSVVSVDADEVRYSAVIYYDPRYVVDEIEQDIITVQDEFRANTTFGGDFIKSQLQGVWLDVDGVAAIDMLEIQIRPSDGEWRNAEAVEIMAAGYFNFESTSLTFKSIKDA